MRHLKRKLLLLLLLLLLLASFYWILTGSYREEEKFPTEGRRKKQEEKKVVRRGHEKKVVRREEEEERVRREQRRRAEHVRKLCGEWGTEEKVIKQVFYCLTDLGYVPVIPVHNQASFLQPNAQWNQTINILRVVLKIILVWE